MQELNGNSMQKMPKVKKCHYCKGDGVTYSKDFMQTRECSKCSGRGVVYLDKIIKAEII